MKGKPSVVEPLDLSNKRRYYFPPPQYEGERERALTSAPKLPNTEVTVCIRVEDRSPPTRNEDWNIRSYVTGFGMTGRASVATAGEAVQAVRTMRQDVEEGNGTMLPKQAINPK